MSVITQNHILNIVPGMSAPVVVHVSQGDSGVELEFVLVNGSEIFDPTGTVISVHGIRQDGTGWGPVACAREDGKIKFTLPDAATAVKGSGMAELSISNGEETVGTTNFAILVETATFPQGVTYANDVSVYEAILAYVDQMGEQTVQNVEADLAAEIANRQAADAVLQQNINSEASTRAGADTTLQTNLNNAVSSLNEALASEISARTSADSTEKAAREAADDLLDARINQIIAPSGEAPSAAEVTDARVGADGAIYDTLGDAIRSQFSKIVENYPCDNVFDNNFDVSGYIKTTDGTDASSSSYVRTSTYHTLPSFADKYNRGMVIKSDNVGTAFTILFYDASHAYLGYDGLGGSLTTRNVVVPDNAVYYRCYKEAAYVGALYFGFTSSPKSLEYGSYYRLKTNNSDFGFILSKYVNKRNLILESNIIDDYYLNYTNGIRVNNGAYRCLEDKIEISPSTQYLFAAYNKKGAPSNEFNAFQIAYYDNNGNYISGCYSSGTNPVNCSIRDGAIISTSPSTAKYVAVGVNDSDANLAWFFGVDDGNVLYSEFNQLNSKAIDPNNLLQGKKIAWFGDSVIGNTRDRTNPSSQLSEILGATVYNFGFGGCRMSVHSGDWDLCSMYRLAEDIKNNDFSALITAVGNGWSGMPGYFKVTAYWLDSVDFSDIDLIIISYGTNDYAAVGSILDNASDKYDYTTVLGALRYSIKTILERYPNIQILVTCPIFRTLLDDNYDPVEYSDTLDYGSGTLLDYESGYKEACNDMNCPYLDLYHTTMFNPITRLNFYQTNDGTHPNAKGYHRIAQIVSGKVTELLS